MPFAVGGDDQDQPHDAGLTGAAVIRGLGFRRRTEGDDGLSRSGAAELFHCGETGVIDADAERNTEVEQHGDQPAGRVSPIRKQVVLEVKGIDRLYLNG